MVSYKFIIFLFISGKFTIVHSLRNLAELTLTTHDTHQLQETPTHVSETRVQEGESQSQKLAEGSDQLQQQQESQVPEAPAEASHESVNPEKKEDLPKEQPEPSVTSQEERTSDNVQGSVGGDVTEELTPQSPEAKNTLQEVSEGSVTQNGDRNERKDGHTEQANELRAESSVGTEPTVNRPEVGTSEPGEKGVDEDTRNTGESGAKGPALQAGSDGPPSESGQLPGQGKTLSPPATTTQTPATTTQTPAPTQAPSPPDLGSGGAGLSSTVQASPSSPGTESSGPTVTNAPTPASGSNTGTGVTTGKVLPSVDAVEELPSRESDSLIHPLMPDEHIVIPTIAHQTGVNTMVRSQTKQVPINPIPNATGNRLSPTPTTNTVTPNPVARNNVVPAATPTPNVAVNPPVPGPAANDGVNKDTGVKNVLMNVLRELETSLNQVNATELVRPEAPNKQSLCEVLNTTNTNICASKTNNGTNSGVPANPELLGLVNRYYVNNACVTENSLNQLYNSGEFSYKLLAKHLDQFNKKAPNKTVQTVYDKSVPVVTKLTELFKDAETALVSDKLKKLLEKRYSVLTTALCGVANSEQDFLSSTELNNNRVTLSLNEEDFINQATKELMKAYEPMVELLREFNTLLPKLFELFEEGFENKINLVSSLAHVKPQESVPPTTVNPGGNAQPPSGAGLTPRPPVTGGTTPTTAAPAHALIQFVDDQDREIAAVHGHPSLIQRIRSLLQINGLTTSDPAPAPKEPAPTTPKPPAAGVPSVSQPRPSSPPAHPGSGVTPSNGLRLLDRASTGGVNVDQHTPRTATSGLSSTSLPAAPAPSSPGAGNLGPRGVVSTPPGTAGPGSESDESDGVFGSLKKRLKSLVSNSPGNPQAPGKRVPHEVDDELLNTAFAQFEHLGIFKTQNNKLVPELDEQKVKTLVRSNLLSLNEFDSMYNLVVGPQRSMHGLYEFVEHLLLSPDADEKISALNDKKLMEQINAVVTPLEDLYEQVKSNSNDLKLRMPKIPVDETVKVQRVKRAAAEHRPSPAGTNFQVVSNSSGVKVSQEGQLSRIKNLFKPLLGNVCPFPFFI
ncbi:uncharacterized protein TA04365 [Theileria annulata]|uniref:Uncharacterized protein n=1 Tax=Theileria annulata TaxID=5874 RepID=Q4UC37_THEAN|nr:uncharacterized protein TA04365 [Theileria annulata]CAI75614.1 hypothetical protein, conserved [Theileria annulata]|eukprot:XP_955090.1 hypothetical protein, conserved [Theileria annulata]